MSSEKDKRLKVKIVDFMKSFCIGQRNAMKQEKIAETLRIEPRLFRHLVEEIVRAGTLAIGGATNGVLGYFIVENQKEYEMIRADLKSRIVKLNKRLRGFEKAYGDVAGQEKMFNPGQFKTLGQQRIKEIREEMSAK